MDRNPSSSSLRGSRIARIALHLRDAHLRHPLAARRLRTGGSLLLVAAQIVFLAGSDRGAGDWTDAAQAAGLGELLDFNVKIVALCYGSLALHALLRLGPSVARALRPPAPLLASPG
ncbi:MAG: hypothetical protein EXR72_15700 [Myxococcales bacterium]|nr:hypothetical protein [Myxococcales bacterium]